MKLRSSMAGALRDLLSRSDARCSRGAFGEVWRLAFRRLADGTQDVEDPRAEDDEVDDNEGDKRGADRLGVYVREAVGGAQQTVDGERLAADFGGVPAGKNRDEA